MPRRLDRVAGDDHLQRLLGTDQTRQSLGSARARQQAELDLGEANACPGDGDPEMAGECHLEPTAEGGTVKGSDDRFRRCLDSGDDLAQARRLRRLAELGDVGASEESASSAGDDHRLDRGVIAG